MIDAIIIKIFVKKRLEKISLKSLFCSLCPQAVVNKPVTFQVLSNDPISSVFKMETESFCFSIWQFSNDEKNHENTRDQYENGKIQFDYCTRMFDIFRDGRKILNPRMRIDKPQISCHK